MSWISKAAVAGVWPTDLGEARITQTFPSISSTGLGRFLGRMYALPLPIGLILHLLTLPAPVLLAVATYVFSGFRRYELTSLRVRIRQGIGGKKGAEARLEDFDEVTIHVRPGQAHYRAGDIELRSHGQVLLVLAGVPNPEPFRRSILAARAALVQVMGCRKSQEARTPASGSST